MQRYKPAFSDPSIIGTCANIQSCLRLNDLNEIDDGTHFLYFNMMGLFSFRTMTVQEAINFWLDFLSTLGLAPDWVTIHPDRPDWHGFYQDRVRIKEDHECTWSDGSISGYCTEFFKNDIEIGNIVNPLGTCIDVGFGLERLDMLVNGTPKPSANDVLCETITRIIDSGYKPGNKEQGYVLRKLLRLLHRSGGQLEHPYFFAEQRRQDDLRQRYERLKEQHFDKSPEWWFDTHGINVNDWI